jgi:adenylate cyclase
MAPEEFKRKLSAILSADVKGYSRLMGEDEEGTIHTLNTFMEVIAGFIQQHRGRVVATGGDSVLAEFASVVDAVRCAVGIQEELKDRNREIPKDRQMEFRIGVNLGDVVEEGDNILGDGVNVAARIESLAEAGGICISGTAYDQVKNKLAVGFEYIGEQTVKNIKEPVRVYRVLMEPEVKVHEGAASKKVKPRQWQGMALSLGVVLIVVAASIATWRLYLRPALPPREVASKQKIAYSLPDKPSIAVLPFNNMSGDPKQEAFADGVAENITTTLAKIPQLFVIARNSAFEYKGKSIDVKKIAKNLGVRYVLEGSIQNSSDQNRITAQLIDATSGYHIWSEKYDRKTKDFFALSDEVTRNIAVAFQIKLTEGEQAKVFYRETENLEAWSLASKGWDLISRFTKEDNARVRELAEQAVKLDPQYGFAWSLLAYSYFNEARMGWCKSPKESKESFTRAIELNQKALRLDKYLFCATAMLGQIQLGQGQYERAIELGRRSIELGPNIAVSYNILASILCYAGNFEEAITMGEKAIRLHPFCPWYYPFYLGMSYRMAGRYEEALTLYKQALSQAQKENSNPLYIYIGLADVYSEMGHLKEAHIQAKEILRIAPTFSLENWSKTEPFKDPANLERRLVALRKAGLK